MASQYQSAITRQEERDHRLAILIQQQETLVAHQLGTKSGNQHSHIDQDIDEVIRKRPLNSSSKTQSEDLETDGLPTGQRSSLDPLLTSFPLSGANSLPQAKGKSVPLMSSRRARRFNLIDSSHHENHVVGFSEHTVWRKTSPVGYLSDPDSSDQSDKDEHLNGIRNTVPSNFNENERTLSTGDEQNPEIQGASNYLERRRSLGNEDEDEDEDEDEISREIEELMKIGAISKSEPESNQQQKFRLNNMTKWQRNNEDEELRPFVFDMDGIPINWTDEGELTSQRPGHSMDVRLVELQPGQMEYDKIDDEFKETGIKITKIERIQNTYLLDRFKAEMESTARRRHSGFDLNIQYLYHGTKADKDRICEEGLDQRLSRMGYFGKGIYFSDNPLKCVYYTENIDSLGDAYILKCRVILGDSKCFPEGQYDTALKREPEKEHVQPGMWRFYDSVVGCPRDYNEFVVYENRRAMIEYIISFKVGPEVTAAMQQLNKASASVAKTPGGEGEPFDDNHLDQIRQVREAVRRKRCQDRGITYMKPNQQKKQQDDHMWNKLQMLHGVKPAGINTEKVILGASVSKPNWSESDNTKIYNTDNFEIPDPVTMELPSHKGSTTGGGNYQQEPDPVDQVMSGLLQEFLGVTSTEDVGVAKYYITSNEMNVNDAILNYYNDLP